MNKLRIKQESSGYRLRINGLSPAFSTIKGGLLSINESGETKDEYNSEFYVLNRQIAAKSTNISSECLTIELNE